MTAKATTDDQKTSPSDIETLTEHPAPPEYVIRVLASPEESDRGRVMVVSRNGLALARHPTDEPALSFESQGVTRHRHARIVWCGRRRAFLLENLGGSAGTFLNGYPLARQTSVDADNGGRLAEPRDEPDRAASANRTLDTARERLLDGDIVRLGRVVLRFSAVRGEHDGKPWQAQESAGLPLRGRSPQLRSLLDELRKMVKNREPALLLGPTGCGKDVLAQFMHKVSGLPGPFVPVNCPGASSDTFESEMFGTGGRRFTGVSEGMGLIERASNGTLFFDEIGDLEPACQAKLLTPFSWLDSDASRGEIVYFRAGATKPTRVRALVVSATCREDDCIRHDLRRRLGREVRVPPLHERPEDIEPIVLGSTLGGRPLSAALWEALMLHDWPANVSGLFTALRAAKDQAEKRDGHTSNPTDGPAPIRLRDLCAADRECIKRARDQRMWGLGQLDAWVRAGEHRPTPREVEWLRQHFAGNVAHAAAHCGFDRAMLHRWLKRYGHYSEEPKPHWSGPLGAPPQSGP